MGKIPLKIGDTVCCAKTFSEADVYRFAGIVGDVSPYYVDEEFCKTTMFKTRTVQPCLTFALANDLSAQMGDRAGKTTLGVGFDELRFLKTVFFGDTITGMFTVRSVDEEQMRVCSDGVMYNQHGETVLTCINIIKVVESHT